MENNSRKKYIIILIMYLIVIAEHLLIEKGLNVNYGKDGGLVFRIFTICFLSALYYMFKDKPLSNFIILNGCLGFVIGILTCYLVFFKINQLLGKIINNEMGGLNVSLIYHTLISITIIVIIGEISSKFQNDSE